MKILSWLSNNKKYILSFLLGGFVFGCGSVTAAIFIASNEVSFTPENNVTESSTVEEALDEIYDIVITGDAKEEEILEEKSAVVKGKKVNGSMTNNGAWKSEPESSTQVVVPEGYHDGEGYVDTSKVYTNGYNDGYDDGVDAGKQIFINENKCDIADGTLLHNSADGGTTAFSIACTGTYKIEYAGAMGGSGTNASPPNDVVAEFGKKGSSGSAYSATVELTKGEMISYVAGTVGKSGTCASGGAGGTPGGSKGVNGKLSDANVCFYGSGGGGGGYTLVYINGTPKLSADGGAGGKGGYRTGYSAHAGGAGGTYEVDSSGISIASEAANAGAGYVKITLVSAKYR